MDNRGKTTFLGRLARKSVIVSFVRRISDKISGYLRDGVFGTFFTSYGMYEEKSETSLFRRLRSAVRLSGKISHPLKRFFSKSVNESAIVKTVRSSVNKLLDVSVRSYGVFLLSFSFVSAAISLIKRYVLKQGLSTFELVFSGACALISLPLLFSKKSAAETLKKNAVSDRLIFGFFGAREETFDRGKDVFSSATVAILAGIAAGVFSYRFRPYFVLAFLFGLLIAYVILCVPETGIALLLLILPFAPLKFLKWYGLFVCVSFFLKFLRGKRTVRFDPLSAAVGCAFLILAFSALFTGGVTEGGVNRLLFMLLFFAAVNLIKSSEWFGRCVASFSFSAFCLAFLTLVCRLSAYIPFPFLSLCADMIKKALPSQTEAQLYLMIALPVMLSRIFTRKSRRETILTALSAIAILAGFTAIADNGTRMTYLIAIAVFAVIGGKKTFASFFTVCVGAFAVFLFLPSGVADSIPKKAVSVLARLSERAIANLKELVSPSPGSSARYSGLIGDFGAVGPLIAAAVFVILFRKFCTCVSKRGRNFASYHSAAIFSGLFAVFIRELLRSSFDGVRVYICFFVLLAIVSAGLDDELRRCRGEDDIFDKTEWSL